MFGRRFFGGAYFGARQFGDGGSIPASGASAAQVWAYVLPNGLTAGETLAQMHAVLTGPMEGTFSLADLLRLIAAVAAGQTRIQAFGGNVGRVEFAAVDKSGPRVVADMTGSERTDVTITP